MASCRARIRSRIASCAAFGTQTAVSSPPRCQLLQPIPATRPPMLLAALSKGTGCAVALSNVVAPLAKEAIPAEAIPAVTVRATNAPRITHFIGKLHLRSGEMSGFYGAPWTWTEEPIIRFPGIGFMHQPEDCVLSTLWGRLWRGGLLLSHAAEPSSPDMACTAGGGSPYRPPAPEWLASPLPTGFSD
jgi:hypothetical protein